MTVLDLDLPVLPVLPVLPAPSAFGARLRSVRDDLVDPPADYGPALLQRLRRLSEELEDVAGIFDELGADGPRPDVSVDPDSFTAAVDGELLPLTYREFRLLLALVEHRGRVLTRSRLMTLAWDGKPVAGETRTVDVHVRRLRVHLGRAAGRNVTMRGVGYRWD